MAFNVEDFHDLMRLLEEHPEWRAELRRQVLSDELLDLPAAIQRLTDAQERTEQRLGALTEAQERTDQRLGLLEERMAALLQVQQGAEQSLAALAGDVRMLVDRVAEHEGTLLEIRYERHGPSYFDELAHRLRVIESYRLADLLDEGVEAGTISPNDRREALRADLVLRGRRRDDGADAYFVVEVSSGVREDDVARAQRRSRIMAKLGLPAVALVAGNRISLSAERMAKDMDVWVVLDGRTEDVTVMRPDASPGP